MLDEADVMIATQGHQDQSIRIHKNLSSACQMMLFSATYDLAVMNFAENIIADPVIIRSVSSSWYMAFVSLSIVLHLQGV